MAPCAVDVAAKSGPLVFGRLISRVEKRVTRAKEPKWLAACTTDMTTTQIAEIMRTGVQDKAAQWHLGMNTLGFNDSPPRQWITPGL